MDLYRLVAVTAIKLNDLDRTRQALNAGTQLIRKLLQQKKHTTSLTISIAKSLLAFEQIQSATNASAEIDIKDIEAYLHPYVENSRRLELLDVWIRTLVRSGKLPAARKLQQDVAEAGYHPTSPWPPSLTTEE